MGKDSDDEKVTRGDSIRSSESGGRVSFVQRTMGHSDSESNEGTSYSF